METVKKQRVAAFFNKTTTLHFQISRAIISRRFYRFLISRPL